MENGDQTKDPMVSCENEAAMKALRKVDAKNIIATALKSLSPKEQEIFQLVHGLDGGCCYTYDEVARILDIGGGRVRCMHADIICILRTLPECQKIEEAMRLVGYGEGFENYDERGWHRWRR